MHYQQDRSLYRADAVPTLLTVEHSILTQQQSRIGKHSGCHFEINTGMLLLVCTILRRIPFEEHVVIHNV